MAQVYVTSTAPRYTPENPGGSDELRRFVDAVPLDRFGMHRLTGDPAQADLIIFVDSARPDLSDIRRHRLYAKYLEKCFVLHHGDKLLPFLPGVYTCPERGTHTRGRTRTGSYSVVRENAHIEYSPDYGDAPFLFSFVGRSDTAEVRRAILKIAHPRALLIDTAREAGGRGGGTGGWPDESYLKALSSSRFVLCPRGYGSSSYRLFEAIRAGRAPVIISDAWIPPSGPEWGSFALFVRESEVARIPQLLQRAEPLSAEMGRLARQTWADWFSDAVIFHRTVESCLELLSRRRVPERLASRLVNLHRCRPRRVSRYLSRLSTSSCHRSSL